MTAAARPLALITGATRGIGAAIARDLATDHRLLIGGRTPAPAAALADELGDAAPFAVDLADSDATAEAVRGIERLEVLVHSAGIAESSSVEHADRATWRKVMELNLIAVADLTRLLLPALRAGNGQVIMINSGSGMVSGSGGAIYSASKFALRTLTDTLREELRGQVRVAGIYPGRVDTDMQREIQLQRGRTEYRGEDYLRPESVAAAVRTAVNASPEATIETLSIRPSNGI